MPLTEFQWHVGRLLESLREEQQAQRDQLQALMKQRKS